RPAGLPAWESLNADQKRLYARMMEVFAGYGAHVDHEVGRVLDAVAKLPDSDNTMIIYIVGDNGASAEGGIESSINENAFFQQHLGDLAGQHQGYRRARRSQVSSIAHFDGHFREANEGGQVDLILDRPVPHEDGVVLSSVNEESAGGGVAPPF